MSYKPRTRVPQEYDPKVVQPLIDYVYDDINKVAALTGRLERDLRPSLENLERVVDESVVVTLFKAEWYQVSSGGTEYAEARIIPVQGEFAAGTIRARSSATNGNIEEGDAWTTLDSSDWITDASYPREGYYRYRVTLSPAARDEDLVTIQAQVLGKNGVDMILNESHTFDLNLAPDLRSFKVSVGNFNYATEKWRIYVTWEGDEDFGSIGIGYGTTAYDLDDANVTDADTGDVHDNNRSGSGAFLFEADPQTQYFFVGRAYSGAGGAGDAGVVVHRDDVFTPPNLASADYINDEAITADMLVDTQKRASVQISMGAYGASLEDTVQYDGAIVYADGTTYTMAPSAQTIDMSSSSSLWYFYFDPAIDTNSLQATTSASTAKAISGRRILVGVGKKATAPERAFFVVTSDQPVITAPVINVVKLSALTADVGTLTAGVIQSSNWSTSTGVQFDLTGGDMTFGGSSNPKLSWDNSALQLSITGSITIDAPSNLGDEFAFTTGGYLSIGSMVLGLNADSGGVGNDGIYMDANNYWYDSGVFRVGSSAAEYMEWDGTNLTITGRLLSDNGTSIVTPNTSDLSIAGTLTMGAGGEINIGSGDVVIDPDGITFDLKSTGFVSATTIEWDGASNGTALLNGYYDGTRTRMAFQVTDSASASAFTWAAQGGGLDSATMSLEAGSTSGNRVFSVTADEVKLNLPTSSAGLSTGSLWNDSGTVKVA